VADGGEPDRRDDHVAGGEGKREARELRDQSGAEHYRDSELTEPQGVDEEAAAESEQRDRHDDRDRAGDEGAPSHELSPSPLCRAPFHVPPRAGTAG
jgi:hypothetical protein